MDTLSLSQVSRRTEKITPLIDIMKTRTGWIHCIRQALSMTTTQLASRLKTSQSSVSEFEKRELSQSISLKKLNEIANALGCDLAYAFVPREPLKDMVETIAHEKALRLLSLANTHMSLENQKVNIEMSERLEELKRKLISSGDIW